MQLQKHFNNTMKKAKPVILIKIEEKYQTNNDYHRIVVIYMKDPN